MASNSLKNLFGGPGPIAQLVGASSCNQSVAGSIPSQGSYGKQPFDVSFSH